MGSPLNPLQIRSTAASCSSSLPFIDEARRSCCHHRSSNTGAVLASKFVATSCFCCSETVFFKLLPVPPPRALLGAFTFLCSAACLFTLLAPDNWERLKEVLCLFLSPKISRSMLETTSYLTKITTGIGDLQSDHTFQPKH